jgi:hypothetical protein
MGITETKDANKPGNLVDSAKYWESRCAFVKKFISSDSSDCQTQKDIFFGAANHPSAHAIPNTHTHTRARARARTHTHAHTHTHTYIHTHTHTHTHHIYHTHIDTRKHSCARAHHRRNGWQQRCRVVQPDRCVQGGDCQQLCQGKRGPHRRRVWLR